MEGRRHHVEDRKDKIEGADAPRVCRSAVVGWFSCCVFQISLFPGKRSDRSPVGRVLQSNRDKELLSYAKGARLIRYVE